VANYYIWDEGNKPYSEVKEVSEKEYKGGLAAPVNKPTPTAAPAAVVAPAAAFVPVTAPAPAAEPSSVPTGTS